MYIGQLENVQNKLFFSKKNTNFFADSEIFVPSSPLRTYAGRGIAPLKLYFQNGLFSSLRLCDILVFIQIAGVAVNL